MIRRSFYVVLFATFSLSAPPAFADAAGEDLVRSALNNISAADGWTASADIVRSEGDRIIVEGLKVANSGIDFRMAIGTLGLDGLSERGGGYFAEAFSVSNVDADFDLAAIVASASPEKPDAEMSSRVTIGSAEGAALFLPANVPSSSGMSGFLASIIDTYAYTAEMELAALTIPAITVEQTVSVANQDEDQTSRTTYHDVRVADWADGVIERYEIGRLDIAVTGGPGGKYSMGADGALVDHIDIGHLVHVLDPARYEGGQGDLVWKTVLKRAEYRGFRVNAPDANVTIGRISMSDFDMRQPEKPLLAGLDKLVASALAGVEPDDEAVVEMLGEFLPAVFSSFHIGDIRAEEIEGRPVVSSDPTGVVLKEIGISGYSGEGIERILIAGLSGAGPGVEIGMETLRFDGIGFPKWESIAAVVEFAQESEKSGGKPELDPATARHIMDIYPTVDLFLMENLSGNAPGKDPFKVDRIRVEVKKRALGFMVGGDGSIEGLVIPAEYFDEGGGPNPLAMMNYDRLAVDLDFTSDWDEASSDIDYLLNLYVADVGDLSLAYRFSGFTEHSIERIFQQAFALEASGGDDFTKIMALFADISFKGLTIAFTDRSIIDRALGFAAAQQGADAQLYRDQLKNALPFLMSGMPPGDFRNQVIAAAQATLEGGKKTTLSLLPANAIMVQEVIATGMQNPIALIDLLGAAIEAEPAN